MSEKEELPGHLLSDARKNERLLNGYFGNKGREDKAVSRICLVSQVTGQTSKNQFMAPLLI